VPRGDSNRARYLVGGFVEGWCGRDPTKGWIARVYFPQISRESIANGMSLANSAATRVHAYIRRASCSFKSRNFVYIRFRHLSVSTSNPVEAADGAIYLPDRCIQIWIADVAWRLDDAREVGDGRRLFSRAGYSTPSSSSSSSSSSTFGTRAISRARNGAIYGFSSPAREKERKDRSCLSRDGQKGGIDGTNFVRCASYNPVVVP